MTPLLAPEDFRPGKGLSYMRPITQLTKCLHELEGLVSLALWGLFRKDNKMLSCLFTQAMA